MDKKQDPIACCLQEIHSRFKDTDGMKMKGWRKIVHANDNQKRAGMAILLSDKIDFKSKPVTRDKESQGST